mmetsp:Transcript_37928/g.117946  ORF Transcript_37928/g.117946 Transcript_37928/m.117946 type:complete len:291 (+) Transcript_37928:1608-2480(+)
MPGCLPAASPLTRSPCCTPPWRRRSRPGGPSASPGCSTSEGMLPSWRYRHPPRVLPPAHTPRCRPSELPYWAAGPTTGRAPPHAWPMPRRHPCSWPPGRLHTSQPPWPCPQPSHTQNIAASGPRAYRRARSAWPRAPVLPPGTSAAAHMPAPSQRRKQSAPGACRSTSYTPRMLGHTGPEHALIDPTDSAPPPGLDPTGRWQGPAEAGRWPAPRGPADCRSWRPRRSPQSRSRRRGLPSGRAPLGGPSLPWRPRPGSPWTSRRHPWRASPLGAPRRTRTPHRQVPRTPRH